MDFCVVNIFSSFVYFLASPQVPLGPRFPIVSILTKRPLRNRSSPLLRDLSDSCLVSTLLFGDFLTSFCSHPPFTRTHSLSSNLSDSPIFLEPGRMSYFSAAGWGIFFESTSPHSFQGLDSGNSGFCHSFFLRASPQGLLGRHVCSLLSFQLWVKCHFFGGIFLPLPALCFPLTLVAMIIK